MNSLPENWFFILMATALLCSIVISGLYEVRVSADSGRYVHIVNKFTGDASFCVYRTANHKYQCH